MTDERSAYDEKLESILRTAAAIFAEKGYHQASIRDIARATGVSLSGLYYYFNEQGRATLPASRTTPSARCLATWSGSWRARRTRSDGLRLLSGEPPALLHANTGRDEGALARVGFAHGRLRRG
jgi:hypothetical protein